MNNTRDIKKDRENLLTSLEYQRNIISEMVSLGHRLSASDRIFMRLDEGSLKAVNHPETGETGLRLDRLDIGISVDVYPAGEQGWEMKMWALRVTPTDREATLFAFEVIRSTPPRNQRTLPAGWNVSIFEHSDQGSFHYSDKEIKGHYYILFTGLSDLAMKERSKVTQEQIAAKVPGATVEATIIGETVMQARGDWNGYPLHFRVRGTEASLKIGLTDPEENTYWSAEATIPEYSRNIFDTEKFIETFTSLAEQVEPLSPGLAKTPAEAEHAALQAAKTP